MEMKDKEEILSMLKQSRTLINAVNKYLSRWAIASRWGKFEHLRAHCEDQSKKKSINAPLLPYMPETDSTFGSIPEYLNYSCVDIKVIAESGRTYRVKSKSAWNEYYDDDGTQKYGVNLRFEISKIPKDIAELPVDTLSYRDAIDSQIDSMYSEVESTPNGKLKLNDEDKDKIQEISDFIADLPSIFEASKKGIILQGEQEKRDNEWDEEKDGLWSFTEYARKKLMEDKPLVCFFADSNYTKYAAHYSNAAAEFYSGRTQIFSLNNKYGDICTYKGADSNRYSQFFVREDSRDFSYPASLAAALSEEYYAEKFFMGSRPSEDQDKRKAYLSILENMQRILDIQKRGEYMEAFSELRNIWKNTIPIAADIYTKDDDALDIWLCVNTLKFNQILDDFFLSRYGQEFDHNIYNEYIKISSEITDSADNALMLKSANVVDNAKRQDAAAFNSPGLAYNAFWYSTMLDNSNIKKKIKNLKLLDHSKKVAFVDYIKSHNAIRSFQKNFVAAACIIDDPKNDMKHLFVKSLSFKEIGEDEKGDPYTMTISNKNCVHGQMLLSFTRKGYESFLDFVNIFKKERLMQKSFSSRAGELPSFDDLEDGKDAEKLYCLMDGMPLLFLISVPTLVADNRLMELMKSEDYRQKLVDKISEKIIDASKINKKQKDLRKVYDQWIEIKNFDEEYNYNLSDCEKWLAQVAEISSELFFSNGGGRGDASKSVIDINIPVETDYGTMIARIACIGGSKAEFVSSKSFKLSMEIVVERNESENEKEKKTRLQILSAFSSPATTVSFLPNGKAIINRKSFFKNFMDNIMCRRSIDKTENNLKQLFTHNFKYLSEKIIEAMKKYQEEIAKEKQKNFCEVNRVIDKYSENIEKAQRELSSELLLYSLGL